MTVDDLKKRLGFLVKAAKLAGLWIPKGTWLTVLAEGLAQVLADPDFDPLLQILVDTINSGQWFQLAKSVAGFLKGKSLAQLQASATELHAMAAEMP